MPENEVPEFGVTRIPFDAEGVRQLATILTDTGIAELEIIEGDSRIRLVRFSAPPAAAPMPGPAMAAAPEARHDERGDAGRNAGAVLSPMVGIAYLSPEPGAAPFTAIGQAVTAGQTLMLIEAMKTFNQVKAPKAGTVRRILVAAGAPVEYGEPLMIID